MTGRGRPGPRRAAAVPRSRGFTLVEVIVALLLLAVGLLAVATLTVTAARRMAGAARTEAAAAAAAGVADSLRAARASGPGEEERRWGVLRWEPAGDGLVRIVATAPEGGVLVELYARVGSSAGAGGAGGE